MRSRIRIAIGTRLFLALIVVSLVILSLNAAVTRWNFERGFVDYVARQEAKALAGAAAELAELYRSNGNWEMLRASPRRWNELLRRTSDRPPPDRLPPPPGGRPPPPDPMEFGRRISLIDADGRVVVGRQRDNPSDRPAPSVPVVVDGATVGSVVIAPSRRLTDEIDQRFAREQSRSIYLTAFAALAIAAGIAAMLARQLTRPIRTLADGARAVTAGRYDTRIPDTRTDELGDLARDFNRLTETLERDRTTRRQWVSDIAHELRTPLAIMRGELDAVEDGVRPLDTKTLRSLHSEVARLTELVSDLHELSLSEESRVDDDRTPVDAARILSSVLDAYGNRLEDAGIVLERHVPARVAGLLANRKRLEQLFGNLIENTIRYTRAPGKLVVTCVGSPDDITIEFADSAPGVPADAILRLFDRLYRVDASRSRETGGSGLGLSIAKAVVDALDGNIEALDSDLGGLRVRIRLPLPQAGGADS